MITLEEIRSQYPGANSLSDDELIGVVAERYGTTPDIFREAIGYKPAPVESPGIIGRAKDLGISALKGAIAVPEAAVGLADLVTGGYAGKAAEAVGFRPKEAKAILSEGYSDAQKRANEEVQKAEGVWDTVKAVAANPSVLAQTITESVPSMLGGGVVAGGLIKGTRLGATVGGRVAASGIGEGVVGAGSGAEQIRQQTEDGLLTGGQAAVAGLSGVATGALGVLGAKVAKSLGIADVDSMLAGAAQDTVMAKGVTRRILEGAISEGLIEELPQSVQEQVAQNYALGKPLDEGVSQAAVLGTLSGSVMGAGANLLPNKPAIQPPKPPPAPPKEEKPATPEDILKAPDADSAIATFTASLSENALAAGSAWQDMVRENGIIPPEQALAQQRRSAVIADAGQQFQDLGIRTPQEDIDAQKRMYAAGSDWQTLVDDMQAKTARAVAVAEQAGQQWEAIQANKTASRAEIGKAWQDLQDAIIARDAEQKKQIELDQLQSQGAAVEAAATVEAPTAMQLAMQRARAGVIPNQGQPLPMTAPRPVDPTPVPAAPEAPAIQRQPDILPGDISRNDGKPFQTENGARLKQREAGGIDGSEIVAVQNGFVVRPKTTPTDPTAATPGQTAGMQSAASGVPAAVDPTQPINQPLTTENTSAQTPEAQQSPPPGQTPAASAAPVPASIPDPVQPAEGGTVPAKAQADPRLIPVSKRAPAQRDDLTDDETTAEFERLYQEDVKADIRRRLGMEPPAKEAKPKASAFRTFLRKYGINPQHASDITGERGVRANNRLPATFRRNGLGLDELALRAVESGYLTQADLESDSDNGGTNKLMEMIQAEIRGERQETTSEAGDSAEAQLESVRRAELEDMATALGIPFDAGIDPMILASMVSRVQRALDASKEPKGSTKADRVRANAVAAAQRIEAKRQKYERELEEFAKASIREQNAFLEVLMDDDGTPVVNRLADQQADDAWNELLGAWEDQNGQTETPAEPPSRQAGTPDGAGAAQRPGDAQEGDSGQQRGSDQSQEEGLKPTRESILADLGPEPKPAIKGSPTEAEFQAYLAWNEREDAAKIAAIGKVGDIAIVKHDRDDRWLMILPDVEGDGKWRTQSFGKDGFTGHEIYGSKEKAIASAASSWFIQRDDGALDRMQDTPEFQRGLYAAELIQRLNRGEIDIREMNRLMAERQAANLALTAPTRADVLRQQAQAEAEAQRKDQGGDKPNERKVTGDTPDMFNTQGSVFDQPAEDDPATEPDWMEALFGTPAEQAASQARFEATAATNKAGIARVRGAIADQQKRAKAEYDDWSGRVYKKNKTQVDLRGDGPSNQGSMSIGGINESRRQNALTALTQEMSALDNLAEAVSTDSGVEKVLSNLRDLLAKAETIAAGGNGIFKTAGEQFEYMLLDYLKFRGPGGKGNVTSNGLSKAILAAIKPAAADPTTQAATILDAANVTGKDRLDILKDVKSGALTPGEVQAAFPGVSPPVANESPAEYDVSEPGAPYETDLFGQPVPAPAGRTGSARPASAGVRGNVQPSIGVQDTPAPAGEYFASTLVGSEVSRELGASRITKPEHAAQATSYLYKSAVERMDGIVTDKDGKPLAIVGGFKGALAQAPAYPATLMAEAVRIPGAAKIWFSHNHPSGNPELSNADRRLGEVLSDVFYGSGIEPMGMLAIGSGRFSHIMGGNEIVSRDIPTSSASVSVPVIERTLAPNGVTGVTVSSPSAAKQYARDFYDRSKKPGLILLNTQNSIIGWVPITDQMTGELRGTGGLNAIYRAISESNAGGAIIVHGGELGFQSLPRQFQRVTPSENIAAALAKIDVRPLDSIEITPMGAKSTAESGLNVASGPVYARSTQGRGVNIDDAKAVVASVREALPTAPTIYIMESVAQAPADLRKFIKAAGAENDVDAAYHNGEIYVFPANIPSIERMQFVLAHHEIRHHGLASMLGPRKNAVMLKIHESNPKIRALAAEQVRKGYAKSRILATEEALADMPVADLVKLNGFDRIVAAVREWLRGAAARLRRAGLGNIADAIDAKTWTDKDVVALIARAEGVSRGGSAKYASEGTVFGQDGDMPAFYSALTREINANTARAQPAMGWASTIQGLVKAGKIKQDEVDWSGVLDWLRLQGGKVTREQLVDYLDANGVKVEETVLGAPDYSEVESWWGDEGGANEETPFGDLTEQEKRDAAARYADEVGQYSEGDRQTPKYAAYQLPGGTNYREVLLTLPAKSTADPARAEYEVWASRNGLQPNATFTEERYKRETGNDAPAPRTMTAMNADAAQNFKSTHWDQPNVLAHIRVNDRVDADGRKTLFVEEIQSDWAQGLRKNGTQTTTNRFSVRDINGNIRGDFATADEADAYLQNPPENMRYLFEQRMGGEAARVVEVPAPDIGIPSGPFVGKTDAWLSLALKRIVKMAVDEGYDRVAFVNGDQSAERYDLSKQVDQVSYSDDGVLRGFQGRKNVLTQTVAPEKIEDYIGKEVAKRLMDAPMEDGRRVLMGESLKVGGAGMVAFYDKIVPNTLKDVLRKVGGGSLTTASIPVEMNGVKAAGQVRPEQVGEGRWVLVGPDNQRANMMTYASRAEAMEDADTSESSGTVLAQTAFDITPAMREKAAGGLPMFDRNADLAQLEALLRAVAPGRSESAASVRDMVSPLSDKWSIPITVVQRPDQLPVPAPSDARGLYHNGAIYLVASNLNSRAAVMRTLGHEAIAHHGLREMLGDEGFSAMMRQINMAVKAGNPAMRKISEYVRRTYVDEDGKFELTPEQEADEIAARAVEDGIDPESGEFRPGFGWLKGVFAKVAQFLRDLGITIPMSNAELQGVLVNSMRGLEAGAKLQGQNSVMAAARAYHGSPHKFDKFTTSAIGTGEGAQAYGWGLYFASKREIADYYRKALSTKTTTIDGAPADKADPRFGAIMMIAAQGYDQYVANTQLAIDKGFFSKEYGKRLLKEAVSLKNANIKQTNNKGQIYEVEIPEESEMLLWDKPLSEQPKKVRAAVQGFRKPATLAEVLDGRSIPQLLAWVDAFDRNNSFDEWVSEEEITDPAVLREAIIANYNDEDMGDYLSSSEFGSARTGESMYREMAAKLGSDKAASEALSTLGVKGIKYLDGSSRSDGDGTFNYVVFSEDDVAIQSTMMSRKGAQTDSPEFKAWFKDSKVVDAEGKPLVVYHGTDSDFATFNAGRGDLGKGIYFASAADDAASYASPDGRGANVMPVYVSIQNPYYWTKEDRNKSADKVNAAARRAGHDGIIRTWADSDEKHIIAFDPAQVKSAIGNNGDFDPANPDIRFARSVVTGATIPQAWQAPDPSKMDDFLYSVQDKHIDTKRVVTAVRDAIGGIADNLDPYLQEELYHGRAAKATKDFLEQAIRPLMVDMQARGVEMSDFEEYLHNRHAERRNDQVAKVNPNMPDGGSGIKTADARAYLAGLPAAKRTAYQALARRVDQMNRDTRALLVSSGLEKQSTIDAWQAAYGDEYVPLMREEMDNGAMGIGQGFSVRGSSSKRAMGSNKPVANIMANIALQREKAITRAEKRRIGEALYGMVLSAPNPDFWFAVDPALEQTPAQITATSMQLISMGLNPIDAEAIAREPRQRYIDPRTGQVAERINPVLRSADNVLAVRIDGEDKYVFFNAQDPRAMRMAKALKNLDADQLGTVMGNVAKMTRYFAAVNTQFNPVFGVVNLTRDIQTALLNLQSTGLAGKQAEVMKHVGSALRGIYIDLRDHRAGKTPTSTWAGLFEEFQREGGATGYRDMYANAQERAGAIADELKKVKQGKAMEFGRGVFGWLSDYNESMENAVRLATYKVAKEQGMSSQQAASIAKNLTVNFNRKGQVALQAGAMYAFFNAAVQGTARMAETMFAGGKLSATGKKIMTGGLLLGSMQALLLAAAGYDDEEPPDFVRERSLVLPIGGDKYVSIPMPLGFHVIPNLARIPTEWAMGGFKDTPKRIGQLVGLFADAFNPIGSAGLSLQTLAPTIIDPLAALAENRDWTGKPIAKKDFNSMQPTAGHTRAKDTATPWGRAIAYGVNWVTGGTDYKPGMASPTPDQIDYLIGQATGGVGREVSKLSQVAGSTVSGEELPLYKIPLLGRFVGTTAGQAAESGRFYENLKQIGEHDAELSGLKKDRRMAEYQEYMRDNPEARLVPIADRTYREVSKLIRMKRDALKAGASTERIKMLDQQITARMAAFNQRVRATETRETATQE